MIQLTLQGAGINVLKQPTPDGLLRIIRAVDQSGIVVDIPLTEQAWNAVVAAGSGLHIANGSDLPPRG